MRDVNTGGSKELKHCCEKRERERMESLDNAHQKLSCLGEKNTR